MKKLKTSSEPEAKSPSLMDEEPPESFNFSNESGDNEEAGIIYCETESKEDYPSLLSDVVVSDYPNVEREFIQQKDEDLQPTEPFDYSETVENVFSVKHVDPVEYNRTTLLDHPDSFELNPLSDSTLSSTSINISESIVSSVSSVISFPINENSKSFNSNSAIPSVSTSTQCRLRFHSLIL